MSPNTTLERAARLRSEADGLPSPLAMAYKRRAAELELRAHVLGAYEPLAVAA